MIIRLILDFRSAKSYCTGIYVKRCLGQVFAGTKFSICLALAFLAVIAQSQNLFFKWCIELRKLKLKGGRGKGGFIFRKSGNQNVSKIVSIYMINTFQKLAQLHFSFSSWSKISSFLFQQNDNCFKTTELLGMARGVASGMKYLADLGYIHRVIKSLQSLQWHVNCQGEKYGRFYMLFLTDFEACLVITIWFYFRIWLHVTFWLMINKYAKFQTLV